MSSSTRKPLVGVPTLAKDREAALAVLDQCCAAAGLPVTQAIYPNRSGSVKAYNVLIKKAYELKAPYVAILNNDLTSCSKEWLVKMIAALELDERNVVAFPSGVCSADRMQCIGRQGDPEGVIDVPVGSMFAVVFKVSVFDTVGMLSEEYIHWASDDDFCNRVWEAGLKCVWVRHVYFGHDYWSGGTAQDAEQAKWQYYDRKLYFEKWNIDRSRRKR